MSDALDTRMSEFVEEIGRALGLALQVDVEAIEDGTRVRLAGDGSDVFLQRRAAGLQRRVARRRLRWSSPRRWIA